jgi:hypothetical protein
MNPTYAVTNVQGIEVKVELTGHNILVGSIDSNNPLIGKLVTGYRYDGKRVVGYITDIRVVRTFESEWVADILLQVWESGQEAAVSVPLHTIELVEQEK